MVPGDLQTTKAIIVSAMTLSPGTKLGPYEIQSLVGAGGMGEVYRARDIRLDRTVAIKILPSDLSEDSTLRQRFEREAKVVSSLNHPHICAVHDVGNQDGISFLVMEYVDGEVLAKRLEKGPLPIEHVLRYGTQIADALDKAHRGGVVHRDLKPGNIMLTASGAKLLDFGLAKATSPLVQGGTLTATTASTTPVTGQGMIVGTLQYMSPEQIEGKEVDARSDIFSFRSVLYEMVTGRRAFPGTSMMSVASAILEKDPAPISTLQPLTPPALDHVIRKCLAKAPDDRWQTARDLMSELKWIASGGAQVGLRAQSAARTNYNRMGWILVAVLLLTVLALSTVFRRHVPTGPPIVRFLVTPPEDSYFNVGAHMAVSPDGRHLTFVAPDSTGKEVLWVRSFDSLRARALDGTDGAMFPFWSPDSRWIGFFANPNLKKIDLTGGPPISICNGLAGNSGTWNRDGVIVFGSGATHLLYRVSAAGGQVVSLYNEKEAVARGRRGAYFLSDGNHYLYDASQTGNGPAVYVASLGSDTGKLLVQGGASPVYQQGRLLYLHGGTLIAQPFDEKRLEVVGAASALAEQVQTFSASQTGAVLAYWTGAQNLPQLIWVDQRGNQVGRLGAPVNQVNIRISPDGTKVAAEIYEQQNVNSDIWHTNSDIWLYDVMRGVKTRLTTGPGSARVPCWSPDGKHIIFSSDRKGHYDLYEKAIDGAGSEVLVFESELGKYCGSFSPDGKFLLYMTFSSDGNPDLWILPFFGDRKPFPYLHTEFAEGGGRYSPDGKWIAYSSDESGKEEVYVRPFPESGGKVLVSTSGGSSPHWGLDGKEIFYVGASRELMAAKATENGSTLAIDTAKPLFQAHTASDFPPDFCLDVSADGQRFLIVSASSQKLPFPIAVVINWDAGLKTQ
jgi:eukaryotic-like serine/threonine-protein kinase